MLELGVLVDSTKCERSETDTPSRRASHHIEEQASSHRRPQGECVSALVWGPQAINNITGPMKASSAFKQLLKEQGRWWEEEEETD
jgi:hypothetical protein